MNSLLQALYMTPEFRRFIYSFTFQSDLHGSKQFSIPYQLQRVFAQLSTSRRRAVETRSLTKSFGWESAQSFEQHDVQELCRVLFDAIEQSFAIAGQQCSTLVLQDLYRGQLVSYVRCELCGFESASVDAYLDLSLPIKNNPSDPRLCTSNCSLEMALENYLRPERLEGDNQY